MAEKKKIILWEKGNYTPFAIHHFHKNLMAGRCSVVAQSLFSQTLNNNRTTTEQRPAIRQA